MVRISDRGTTYIRLPYEEENENKNKNKTQRLCRKQKKIFLLALLLLLLLKNFFFCYWLIKAYGWTDRNDLWAELRIKSLNCR